MNLDYAPGSENSIFEKNHWWVRSRFGLLDRAMRRLEPKSSLTVLEAGCGTGINMDYLETRYSARLARLIGIDPAADLQQTGLRTVRRDMPTGELFDLILAMDVLEHVDRPGDFLAQLRRQLKPSGLLLVTVPAFQSLWTAFDELAHHRKRYAYQELVSELHTAHFILEECFFLFGTLFPFFVLQRLALKWRPKKNAHLFKPAPSLLNSLLYAATFLEMHTWMPWNRWFGSSIAAYARPATEV